MRAFVITPIAPHALTNRPLVVEGTSKVHFKVRTECNELALLIDGHERLDIKVNDKFTLEAAPQDFPLISHGRYSYYDISSNRKVYDYRRHIVGAYVNFRFD